MFEINQQNIPFVRTRQALLVIDLQNDFISTGGLVPVETPPDFVEKILEFVPTFRNSGNNIVWIHSVFEASRPVNETHGNSESVITEEQLPIVPRRSAERVARQQPSRRLLELQSRIALSNGRALPASSSLEVDDEVDVDENQETFLTVPEGQTPRVVVRSSQGRNFSNAVKLACDTEKDLFFEKSYYSAFRDGTLVQILRAQFVTEIYLVGCITNISVFATAMDAAQHGYAITIIEDGLGYRSKALHDEALRKLTEFTGCDIVQSEEVIADLQSKQAVPTMPPQRNPRRRENGANLEGLMANLNLRPDGSSNPKPPAPAKANGPPVNVATEKKGESSDSLAASESPPEDRAEVEGKKRERVRTRIKTRRRHSNSGQKELGVDGDKLPRAAEKRKPSPTSIRLLGVSEALAKISKPENSEGTNPGLTAAPDASSEAGDTVYTEQAAIKAEHVNGMKNTRSKHDSPASNHEKHSEGPVAICEGDTTVINDLLDEDLVAGIFEKLRDEVRWQKMSHLGGNVPRLVAVQGERAGDGSIPIYRHPADESPRLLPFSPTVSSIQAKVEESLGHPVNHVLIQFYRDGTDYISEHSDKTLDIVQNTYIANVSLGAQRTMVFRTKKTPKNTETSDAPDTAEPRQTCRAPLPHNSMCKVGLKTNMRWLHGIRQDKRMVSERSPEELAFDGGRISLTFRQIGTFLNKDETKIWGQGAVAKSKAEARIVLNGDTEEADRMLKAFGKENQTAYFDWATSYGQGFDVLHISNTQKLLLSGDNIADLRVQGALRAAKIFSVEGTLSQPCLWNDGISNGACPAPERLPVKFMDNDLRRSTVIGDMAIILYLDTVYMPKPDKVSKADSARQYTRFQQSDDLLRKWRAEPFSIKPLKRELELWDEYAAEALFIAGSTMSIADIAVWPVLNEIFKEWPGFDGNTHLLKYYESRKREGSC